MQRSGLSEVIIDIIKGQTKFGRTAGWVMLSAISIFSAVLTVKGGILAPVFLIVLVTAVPMGLSVLWNLKLGVHLMVVIAFFLNVLSWNFQGIPFGIMIDALIFLMFSGVTYRCYLQDEWSVFHTPVSWIIFIWAGYNLLQFFNPEAASRVAWFYVMRPAMGYLMMYFLCSKVIVDYKSLINFLLFIIFVSTLDAFWGIYQSFFGYLDYEMAWVYANDAIHLVFNYGKFRSFGTIGSPAQYGIIMCLTFLISISVMGLVPKGKKRFLMLVSIFSCFMATVYSGTRSAYVIPPLFIFTSIVLSRNFKMYGLIVVMGLVLGVLANIETDNWYIMRIQSVFKAKEDKSYQVREESRKMITPWILSHPVGGGLGSTGVWGQRFSPGTFLAEFPPDSGLIRVGVEMGWIGLIIFLILYFAILISSTLNLWKMKDPRYMRIARSIIAGIAPLLVIETSQEVVGVFPMSLLFWMFLAILFRAIALDKEQQEQENRKITSKI